MDGLLTTVEDGLARLVLDRPKVNAFGADLIEALAATFQRITEDDAIRGVLITAEGRCFSAGLDLSLLAGLDRAGMQGFFHDFDAAFLGAFRCPKPVAVSVRGHAIAGGLVLALTADHLVLGRGDYKLGLTELAIGVPFPRGAFEIARALRHLVYGAGLVDPETAFALGIGDALVDDPDGAAEAWVRTATARPTLAFQITKGHLREPAWARADAAPKSLKTRKRDTNLLQRTILELTQQVSELHRHLIGPQAFQIEP